MYKRQAENNSQRQQRGEGNSPDGNQNGNRGGNDQQSADNDSPNQRTDSTQSQQGELAQNGDNANGGGAGGGDRLRQFAEQLGRGDGALNNGGPITGNDYVNWSDQLRDVESVLEPGDLRNQLATVRDRVAAFRGEYRDRGQRPPVEAVRQQILMPLAQVRVWVQEELTRQENASSLVSLDRDPVPENYSELVRRYYEKLGSAQ